MIKRERENSGHLSPQEQSCLFETTQHALIWDLAYKSTRFSSAVFYVTEEKKEGKATGCTHSCLLHGAICAFAGIGKWKCACMQVNAWG